MSTVAEFCDYLVETPDWFISQLQTKIAARDVRGLTNGRVQSLRVTGEHPLVMMVGAIINPTTYGANYADILPSVAVVEQDEDEAFTMMGQGLQTYGIVNQSWIDSIRTSYAHMENRNREGLITDTQLAALETAIGEEPDQKELFVEIHEFNFNDSVFVSLWAHTLEERKVLGNMLRSVLFSLRKDMIGARLIDIHVRISKGLVNFNFGKILYGMECEITFINKMRNYLVTDEPLVDYSAYDVHTIGKYKQLVDDEIVWDYPKPPTP